MLNLQTYAHSKKLLLKIAWAVLILCFSTWTQLLLSLFWHVEIHLLFIHTKYLRILRTSLYIFVLYVKLTCL